MSVHRTTNGYRVRQRVGGRNRSWGPFRRKADAERFDLDVKQKKLMGQLGMVQSGSQTLPEAAEKWWHEHVLPRLAESTGRRYAQVFDRHLLPRLGGYRLMEITPGVVQQFDAALYAAGVGAPTRRKALDILSGILRHAVLHGAIQINPVTAVPKPRQVSREVHPLAPSTVESVRALLPQRDATIVSVLAYAGLRPQEALSLRWRDVRKRTLHVFATKTRNWRTVTLAGPLASDLAEWRLASGRPGDDALVFSRRNSGQWTDTDYRNWRKRTYMPAAKAVGLTDHRPYDLRHSFVSLLIQEGMSILEVARQAGHSPEVCLRTYAHLFDEFDPTERIAAEDAIRAARVPSEFPEDIQASAL